MKTVFGYFFSSVYVLCVSLCGCPSESDFDYVSYESEISNLASIDENTALFNQGDTLFLTVDIPNRIETLDGKSVDIEDDLGSLSSSFILQLKKFGTFNSPSIQVLSEEEIIVDQGEVYFDNFDETLIYCSALFDDNSYVFRIGIILKDTGDFIISQQGQTTNTWQFFFDDEKIDEDVYESVNLISPLTGEGSTNLGFAFTVEE